MRVWTWVFRIGAAAAVAGAVFLAGIFAGEWLTHRDWRYKLKQAITEFREGQETAGPLAAAAWSPLDTAVHRLEWARIRLPNASGHGGGLAELDDGRLFYAVGHGGFGVIGKDGAASAAPFSLDMNLDPLRKHPVFTRENFSFNWVRITDILLESKGDGRYDFFLGHHWFDPERQCIEMRLLRGVLDARGEAPKLEGEWKRLLTTTPCITFYGPEYDHAFEGHFSGGRIVRFDAKHILYSPGDHGWVGLRGYPSVSQEDDTFLGKIWKVDAETGAATIFAKGVRNPQGLTIDRQGRVWETEHGPRGGDELNLIVEGGNYGWPDATFGTDYGPKPWSLNARQGRHEKGTRPVHSWVPSIGVSNVIQLGGAQFANWEGDLLVASLYGNSLHRLRLDGDTVIFDEPIRFEGSRLRDLIELKDGRIAVLTDEAKVLLLRNPDLRGLKPYLDPADQQARTVDLDDAARATAVAGFYAGKSEAAKAAMVAADVQRFSAVGQEGLKLFRKHCATCHTMSDQSHSGPSLKGVVGRPAGTLAGFSYSTALAGKGEPWTRARIERFIADPNALYPDAAMAPLQLNGEERRAVSAYLAEASR
jgi:cytochrome c2